MEFLTVLGFITILLSYTQGIKCTLEVNSIGSEMILYDFTKDYITEGWLEKSDTKDYITEGWLEKSDTVREVGMSKAILSIQNTKVFNRAVLFTLLNPQPNGACFAGVRRITSLNLQKYKYIQLKIRGQGENYNYSIVLRHKNKNEDPNPTYEHFFIASTTFDVISLPLNEFKPYYHGKELNNTEPLDTSFITSFGIQIKGGVYLSQNQKGVSSLEIDWIKAVE